MAVAEESGYVPTAAIDAYLNTIEGGLFAGIGVPSVTREFLVRIDGQESSVIDELNSHNRVEDDRDEDRLAIAWGNIGRVAALNHLIDQTSKVSSKKLGIV